MFESPLPGVQSVFVLYAHAAWQAALLAFCVLAITWLLGRWLRPGWRFALWLVVFVRLALPVLPAAPWSPFQFVARPVARPNATTNVNLESPPAPVIEHSGSGRPADANDRTALVSDAKRVAPTPSSPSATPARGVPAAQALLSPLAIATSVWLIGFAVFVVRWIAGEARLHIWRRAWTEVKDADVLALLRQCCRELRVSRAVKLIAAPDDVGPAVYGIVRPCILVPRGLLATLSPAELRLVLFHELVHIRRRDVLVDRLVTLVTFIHWFHPVGWIARSLLRRERELACDSLVLDRANASEAAVYGQVILKAVRSHSLQSPRLAPVGMVGPGRFSLLQRRIRMIAAHQKPKAATVVASGAVFLALALVGLTDAQPQQPPAAREELSSQSPARGRAASDEVENGDDQAKTRVIAGVIQDENQDALQGVTVALYRATRAAETEIERLQVDETDEEGRFQFEPVPALPAKDSADWLYAVVVTSPGRASRIENVREDGDGAGEIRLSLVPAATLDGRVTDVDGQPIAGATVFVNGIYNQPLPGVASATTDTSGRCEITDLAPFDAAAIRPVVHKDGSATMAVLTWNMTVQHPNYGRRRALYKKLPATVDVQLPNATPLEGRVVDEATGQPAEGVTVFVQGVHNGGADNDHYRTKTDADGKYRFGSLLEGKYNVLIDHPERVCDALDSFAVTAGKTAMAPDIRLGEGAWIEGQVIDSETGNPFARDPASGHRLRVALSGPSRPRSGAACLSVPVDDRGRFRLQVAPGRNFPYIQSAEIWQRTHRREFFQQGIDAAAGEIVSLVFRILREVPVKIPEPAPVRLTVPVAAEREAAVAIRDLGGWYQVDADRHVIEVNMVYHETPEGVRYDNDLLDSDAALAMVGAFPKLQRLYLAQWPGDRRGAWRGGKSKGSPHPVHLGRRENLVRRRAAFGRAKESGTHPHQRLASRR